MPIAKVERYNGAPAILIDGVPYPPMTMTTQTADENYLRSLGEAGIKIYYVDAMTTWNRPDGLEYTTQQMDFLLKCIPDAYVMLRLNTAPPPEWVNAHPEEMVTYNDGSHEPVICTTVKRGVVLDGMHSLCSAAWRRDAEKAMMEYFDSLESASYFDRVIGFFLCAGGTSEWYYPQRLVLPDGRYGDFSEAFRAEYEQFLRSKYGTVEELRRAWKREDATFEHPFIPTVEEREFIEKADEKIAHALHTWESESRTIGAASNLNALDVRNLGVFLNVNRYAHVADFFDAWHQATANTVIGFSKILKTRFPTLLVGAFYGSYGCTEYFDCSTATGTLSVLDCGTIDFLAAPGVYNNREPGGIVAQRQMQDSFRLRNMIYICEDDARTHRCAPWIQRDGMGLYTMEDSITTLKRDFARDLCEDVHGWWFDMGGYGLLDNKGNNWYRDKEILQLFARQQEVARYAYSLDRAKKNDIALLYDTQSLHNVSQPTSQMVLDFWRTSDLERIGAPVDYYFHDDVSRENMPDYKLYIAVNLYHLTEKERKAIHDKARKNHATVLWLYAPGFVDPTADIAMDNENIEKTIGMKVRRIDKTFFPHFRVDPKAHPALALATKSRRYGLIDRNVHSNVWVRTSELSPAYVNPGFEVTDENATVLGRYCHNGEAALALTDKDGYNSIYCATPVLRSDLIASIAAWSGCHLFANAEDVLYANESFVCVHASSDGQRTIRFKRPCSPYEVYERKLYGENVTEITVDMELGQTLMWCVNGKC